MSYVEEIDRLKAEVKRLEKARVADWRRRNASAVRVQEVIGERDRARDLAAHLEEELARPQPAPECTGSWETCQVHSLDGRAKS